MFDSVAIHWTK